MPISKYRKKKFEDLGKKSYVLYKQGLTLREVGKTIGMSHEWVRKQIKKLSTANHVDGY